MRIYAVKICFRPVTVFIIFFLLPMHPCFCFSASALKGDFAGKTRFMMHTVVEIKVQGINADKAVEDCFYEMDRVNNLLNNYNPESDISRINRNAGFASVKVQKDTIKALELALKYADITGGAFDLTIGPLLKLWGFASEKAGTGVGIIDPDRINAAMKLVNYKALYLTNDGCEAGLEKKGMYIDAGAFSKGFVADCAMKVIKKYGIKNGLIAAGGTVLAIGKNPGGGAWRVGVRHPEKADKFLTVVSLENQAISTSGDYERFYEKNGKKYTHIIDPRTGTPVATVRCVSVIADSAAVSDILSTALFVLGPDRALQVVNSIEFVEAMIVTTSGRIFTSGGWPAKKIFY